jgi:hypothetical protein
MAARPEPTNYELDFTGRRPPAMQAAIEDGMQRAEENACERWKRCIHTCIVAAARKHAEITVDDVLTEYEQLVKQLPQATRPETHNLDAIGPAMVRAAKDGILSSTGKVKRSERPEKHGNRHTVWTSNWYRKEG